MGNDKRMVETVQKDRLGSNNAPITDHLKFIYDYILKYSRLPKHIYSHSHMNYYTKQLRQRGLIIKKGYGVWTTTKDTPLTTSKMHHVTKNIRGHGYHIRLKIPRLKNWHKREDYLKSSSIIYKPIPQGQRIIIRSHKVWLCNDCIVIYYPRGISFYAYTAKGAESIAIMHLESIIISIENKLKCSFLIGKKYLFHISKNHYAKVKDALAKEMNDRKQKIYCYIAGKQWCVIDHSLNKDETETLKPETARSDMDNVLNPFLTDLKQYYDKTGETILLSDVIKAHGMYAENVVSHINAIKELGSSVRELTELVKKANGKEVKE